MNKKFYVSMSVAILVSIITYIAIIPVKDNKDTANDTKIIQNDIDQKTGNTKVNTPDIQRNKDIVYADIDSYIIQNKDNKLYIYQSYTNGFKELIQTVDINASVLPEKDVIMLQDGISLDSYDEVCSVIEDFSS